MLSSEINFSVGRFSDAAIAITLTVSWNLSHHQGCRLPKSQFSSVQSLSHVRLFATSWTAARQTSQSITPPGVHPNPCPLCQWCHPTISSSVIPFSKSFPASGSFQMSQLSASCGQSIGVSPSTSVPPMKTQDWSPLGWTGWVSL